MIFSYESVAISKKTYFSIVIAHYCKCMETDHNFGHSYSPIGLTFSLPVGGGVIPKSGSVTIYLLPVASY